MISQHDKHYNYHQHVSSDDHEEKYHSSFFFAAQASRRYKKQELIRDFMTHLTSILITNMIIKSNFHVIT